MVRFSTVLLFLLGIYNIQHAQSTVKGIVKDGTVVLSSTEDFSALEMLTTFYYMYYSSGVVDAK